MDQAKLPSVLVVAVEGDVILVDAQGNSRALNSGEFVGGGDIVVTPANGSFSLNTDGNQSHTVDSDSAVFFNFDPLEDGLVLAEVDVDDQTDAVDFIQQLIVEGRDPTELLENPAAGEPVLSSGFSPFINIARSTRFVLAEAGFDTSAGEFSDPAVEILFEEDVLRNFPDTTAPGETDGSVPVVSIPEAVDGINAAELADGAQAEITLPTGTEAGDTVTLTVTAPDGSTEQIEHTVTPDDITDGQAEVTIPADVLSPDGEFDTVAEVADPSGNTSEPSVPTTVEVDTTAPGETDGSVPVITVPEAEGGLNQEELTDGAQTEVTLPTGTEVGDIVTLTVTDPEGNTNVIEHTVTPEEAASGQADITIPAEVLSPDGEYNIIAEVTDPAGNTSDPSVPITVEVDTTAPGETDGSVPVVSIPEAVDGINEAELTDGAQTEVTLPTGTEVGDTVTLTVTNPDGNTNVIEHTVTPEEATSGQADITIPAEVLSPDGEYNIVAEVTGPAGNTSEPSVPVTVVVDTTAPTASITLDPNITADDIINAAEAGSGIAITGTVGGDVKVGDTVTLVLNDGSTPATTRTGQVFDDSGTLKFSIEVPGSALVSDADTTVEASVTTSDTAGNSATATDTEGFNVDTIAPGEPDSTIPVVTIPESVDGINAEEFEDGVQTQVTLPTGTEPGDTLTLIITKPDGNTEELSHTVTPVEATNGVSEVTIPTTGIPPEDTDGTYTVVAEVTDTAGNTSEPSVPVTAVVDTTAPTASITLDANITDDDIVNAAEAGSNVAISGMVGGDVKVGDTVTLILNDGSNPATTRTGQVFDDSGTLKFSIEVPGSALVSDADTTVEASVTTSDTAGNSATATDTEGFNVDTIAPGEPDSTIPVVTRPSLFKESASMYKKGSSSGSVDLL
ncbi:MAG: retention module-containing protein [Amphritea sp.]